MSSQDSDSDHSHSQCSDTESVDSSKKKDPKQEFTDKVKEFLKVDDLIRQKNELVKQKREIEGFLLKYLEDKKVNEVKIEGHTIKRVIKDKKDPIDKKSIKKTLLDEMKKEGFVKKDGLVKSDMDGDKIIQYVLETMEKRPVSKVTKLEFVAAKTPSAKAVSNSN
jgi:hypothetical protein